ncbi:MAG TPA: HD domain-containing phosphohydrolase, partial [Gaiellales bacterium]
AGRLRSAVAPDDCVARWGGEEFAVLLRNVATESDLAERAESLRRVVTATPIGKLRLTVSIGAALGSPTATLDSLLDLADSCLYAAKHDGRNRVSLRPSVEPGLPIAGDEPEAVGVARALAFAAGLREGIPEEHADRVAGLAVMIAEQMRLPRQTVLRCRLAGWLHDVGKLAVPEQILTKPGPLDDPEWEIMRTHPVVGEGVVRRIPILTEAGAGVRHHHERYSGGGYPDGLAGTEIPLEARIVAAADAYAAMTTDRPYSAARTPERAAAELVASSGSHLDPDVVAALVCVLGLDGLAADRAA